MEAFRQWAVSLIIAGIAGTVISLLSPRGTMEKTLRAVIGIFIVSAVVSPLESIVSKDGFLPAFAFENVTVSCDNELGEYMLDTCKTTVGKVVAETAEAYGIENIGVETDMYVDDNKCIIIRDICITIPLNGFGKSHEIEAELEKKLGIPVTVNSE